MRCPTCSATVADDAAVCPTCDAVLDPSLLDAEPPSDDARPRDRRAPPASRAPKKATTRPAPKKPAPPRSAAKAPRREESRRAGSRMPAAPPPQARGAPKRDWREEISQADWDEMPQGPAAKFVPDRALDPDDLLGQARGFIVELSSADKLAFFGSATMFLACFFPWKETVADGDVLGLMSLGVVVFVLSLGAMAAIVMRVRPATGTKRRNPLIPWVAQLVAIGFSELWCVMYAVTSLDTTAARSPVGNFEMWASKPSFGLILAFLAGIVAGLGTVMGLKDTR
jgi:hypothetical protein